MTADVIKEKLIGLGFDEAKTKEIMNDVSDLALKKAIAIYFTHLNGEDKARLAKLSPSDIPQYLEEHRGSLPKLSAEDLQKSFDETWEDYFNNVF
jgi:hypothetical protein